MVFGESEELEIEIFSTKQERCWIGSIGEAIIFRSGLCGNAVCGVEDGFRGGEKIKEEIVDD